MKHEFTGTEKNEKKPLPYARTERQLPDIPQVEQLEAELKRVNYNVRFGQLLRSTVYTLIVVAACAVLVAVLFMPVLRIYGSSMTPTLNEGEIVVSVKTDNIKQGDIIGVYYGSKLLIKRCIAGENQWVNITGDGTVYVDGKMLPEPYVTNKSLGDCDIEMPYQVPEHSVFVLGDHRETSVDSRNSTVGCIDVENIVGRIVFRVWPLKAIGSLNG